MIAMILLWAVLGIVASALVFVLYAAIVVGGRADNLTRYWLEDAHDVMPDDDDEQPPAA